MKILIIASSPSSGRGELLSPYGATLRTMETATETMRENAFALGHKILRRNQIDDDKLVDKTYSTTKAARLAAKHLGIETLTSQKMASLISGRKK